jgi:uncharacterized protein YacL
MKVLVPVLLIHWEMLYQYSILDALLVMFQLGQKLEIFEKQRLKKRARFETLRCNYHLKVMGKNLMWTVFMNGHILIPYFVLNERKRWNLKGIVSRNLDVLF